MVVIVDHPLSVPTFPRCGSGDILAEKKLQLRHCASRTWTCTPGLHSSRWFVVVLSALGLPPPHAYFPSKLVVLLSYQPIPISTDA